MRKSERGVSIWPFVITLVLLLIFVFMWYSEKGDQETKTKELATATVEKTLLGKQIAALQVLLDDLTLKVGYGSKVPLKLPLDAATGETYDTGKNWTDASSITAQLGPDTPGGAVNLMKKNSQVQMKHGFWRPKPGQTSTKVDLEALPQGFKDKVKEVKDAWPGAAPAPADPDDAEAVARYTSDHKDYEAKVEKYKKLMDELVAMKEFPIYSSTVGLWGTYEFDRESVDAWTFWYPFAAPNSLEDFLKAAPTVPEKMGQAMVETVNGLLAQLEAEKKKTDELNATIDNADEAKQGLRQQLEAEQKKHSEDNDRLTKENAAARAAEEQLRVAAANAEQARQKAEQDFKLEVAKLQQTIAAYQNAEVLHKERVDLEIARNDPDGMVLESDPILMVGYMNLGSQDKVYAGLKFEVSSVGRGAVRSTKGEVMITKVLDAHYSQFRVVSQRSGERPIGKGDLIANPFFDKTRTIHLFLAGELKKYPRSIAAQRLARMNVVIDDKIGNQTDFVLIPDSMTAGAPKAEGAEAPAPGAESDYDRITRMARTFGATVITERLLESFLDF